MEKEITSLHFSGSIPGRYDRFLGPLFFEPYAQEIAGRIASLPARNVLELASGTGRVTRHIREVIPPTATLVASDVSSDMLAIAKEKLGHLMIDWQIIDAEQLPFDNDSIDLVVCCFGFMFVPDRPRAYAEARRILRPGGSLLFTTWDKLEENAASHVFRKTVKQFLGDSLPETYKLPFSMHNLVEIRETLLHAGFSAAVAEISAKYSVCASAGEAAFGLMRGGSLYEEVKNRNPKWLQEIPAIVEKELAAAYGVAPMIAPMKAIISQAWK